MRAILVGVAFVAAALVTSGAGAAQRHLKPAGRVVYALAPYGHGRAARGRHFAALVGDPGSGYGFYQLPLRYRVAAWRYKLAHRAPPWTNGVYFAMAADAARYNSWIPADKGYRSGVFNPNDGVGTPFFAGYYDQPEFDPGQPFGQPYPD